MNEKNEKIALMENEYLKREIEDLKREISRLLETLEFYAERRNYETFEWQGSVLRDEGKRAREMLALFDE